MNSIFAGLIGTFIMMSLGLGVVANLNLKIPIQIMKEVSGCC